MVCESLASLLFEIYSNSICLPSDYDHSDVGFMLGGTTNHNYVMLQVHYAHNLLQDETDSSGLTLHYTFTP
jgi:hypothetical protein